VANLKAEQRDRVVLGFGVLSAPFAELRRRTDIPQHADYRLAIARVQAGDAKWRESVKEFARFADDIFFAQEFGQISHVNEGFWLQLQKRVLRSDDLAFMKRVR
jgi:hypothetical protein